MPNPLTRLCLPLVVVAALSACASRATMDAHYDQSLQRWRGATRAELVAQWGQPLASTTPDGREILTWVVREGTVGPAALPVYSTVVTGTPMVSMANTAPTIPMHCMTRFELRDGIVTGWTFEGMSCGAPT